MYRKVSKMSMKGHFYVLFVVLYFTTMYLSLVYLASIYSIPSKFERIINKWKYKLNKKRE